MTTHPLDRRTRIRRSALRWAVAALIATGGTSALARTPAQDVPRPDGPRLSEPGSGQDLQRQMIELFGEVEAHLGQVDELLYEASGADPFGDGSGLATWIDGAESNGRSAVEKIDRLLELADQMEQQQSQSQSGGQSQQQGQNQQQQQGQQGQQSSGQQQSGSQGQQQGQQQSSAEGRNRGSGRSSNERTPEGPDSAGARNEPAEGQAGGDQPGEGSRPDGDGDNEGRGANETGSGEQDRSRQRSDDPRAFGNWGELPPRTQEIFTNTASDDMPPQYRDWIDSYYRRVARSN